MLKRGERQTLLNRVERKPHLWKHLTPLTKRLHPRMAIYNSFDIIHVNDNSSGVFVWNCRYGLQDGYAYCLEFDRDSRAIDPDRELQSELRSICRNKRHGR